MKKEKIFKILSIFLFVCYISFGLVITIYKNRTLINGEKLNKEKIDEIFSNNIAGKYSYIDIYGLSQRLLNKRVIEDAADGKRVIKLKNGQLSFIYPKIETNEWAEKIINVQEYCNKKGIYMLYVDAPWKINQKEDLPFYLKDYVNEVEDSFISSLKKEYVNYIRIKDYIKKDNYFFKTDHHWNIETAFEVYQIIMNNIEDNTDFVIKQEYLTNFNKKTYNKIFLGTYGKRVGKYYSGIDDFTYITPNFETSFEVINNRDWDKNESELKGSFEETLTYKEFLEVEKLDRELSTYYTYGKGTKAEIIIKNNNSYNNKKILILKDSFADPVYPFLSLNFKETRVIDVRRFRAIRLFSYIENNKPDIVLFIHTPTSLYDSSLINFQYK